MLNKFSLIALGAALGFSTMALTGGGASAAALQPFQPLAATQANDGMIQLAASKKERMRDRWERNRDGNRCSKRSGNCRHFHDGFYYETPWWTLPLIIGGSIANDNFGDGYKKLSCGQARGKVLHSGFRNVSTIECNGRTYTFKATRQGRYVKIYVDSRTGAVSRG
jgi:hypothetical protein